MSAPLEELKALIAKAQSEADLVAADSALAEVQNVMASDLREELVDLWETCERYSDKLPIQVFSKLGFLISRAEECLGVEP